MPKSRRNNQIIAVAAIYTYKKILEKSKQRNRTEWVKQWKQDREVHGHMPLLRQLRENYPDDYKNYLRMDSTTFDKLLELVGPKIVKQDTVMRQSISPEERLTATLRFLATGRSLQDLSFTTGIGTSTLCDLIPETCKAMFESLKGEYMKDDRFSPSEDGGAGSNMSEPSEPSRAAKRNSGLFSILKWFRGSSRESSVDDSSSSSSESPTSSSSSSSSTSSVDSANSAGTVASFSFVPPHAYKNRVVERRIPQGPETDTYRERVRQREKVRERDKDLTLRKKYNLFFNRDTSPASAGAVEDDGDNSKSLPLMTRRDEEGIRRRTASESSKVRRAGAYCHVKGKRRAPAPPAADGSSSWRRKKRTAPAPPADVIFNDSLKLDRGILKPAREEEERKPSAAAAATTTSSPKSPRPWYKRNSAAPKNAAETSPDPNIDDSRIDEGKKDDRRKSGLSFLTSISELDREAGEILKREREETVAGAMHAFASPKEPPRRKSARDLIAKFNAIASVTKATVNPFQRDKNKDQQPGRPSRDQKKNGEQNPLAKSESASAIKSPAQKKATPKADRKPWNCPKCSAPNEYWRIICRACSAIKPYFDDRTTPPQNEPKPPEVAQKPGDAGRLERSKTQIGFADEKKSPPEKRKEEEPLKSPDGKREEREKLIKMLIDMKNSLPKRKSNAAKDGKRASVVEEVPEKKETETRTVEAIAVTRETVYENVKVKVSSAAQTTAAVVRRAAVPESANGAVRRNGRFEPMRAKEFAEKAGNVYANLAARDDTLEINRLLRRLEAAIAGGQMTDAAIYARELAQLKVNCSVIRQKGEKADAGRRTGEFSVDMFVEDRLSHRGPFPIRVTAEQTVGELKAHVEKEFEIPTAVQRWILGKELATEDSNALKDHRVTAEGCPVFLYLVAPARDSKLIEEKKAVEDKQSEPKEESVQKQEIKAVTTKSTPINDVKIVDYKMKEPPKSLENIEIDIKIEEVIKKPDPGPVGRDVPKPSPFSDAEDDDYDCKTLKPPPKTDWECRMCTLLNPVTSNVCAVCAFVRPTVAPRGAKKRAPQPAERRLRRKEEPGGVLHYQQLVDLDGTDLVGNADAFECAVCMTDIAGGEGVTLRECLHQFCRRCLANTVEFAEEAEVKCPYRDEQYSCDIALQDREVKALVSADVYERFLARSVAQAENRTEKSFHCKTPDCGGWCIFEDNVNEFRCPVCEKVNCLTCQAIHTGLNCKQYQETVNEAPAADEGAKRTRDVLEEMVSRGEALNCPACRVVLMKKWGCDWVRCSMCKTEICWVTRGPRWGPAGKGDTTGGCKCGVNGIKCHAQCNYCH